MTRIFLVEITKPDGSKEVCELDAPHIRDACTQAQRLLRHRGKIGAIRDPSSTFLAKHYSTVMLIA